MIILILFRRDPLTFFITPTDLVKSRMRFLGNTRLYKQLNGLHGAPEFRSVHFIKSDLTISLIKCPGLRQACVIQGRINTTTLDNALEVKIRLSVTDKIYFFAGQFVLIWRQK